jgi:hypothetical protein
MVTFPTGVVQGRLALQVVLAWAFSLPFCLLNVYRVSTEDTRRIFGHNIIPQCPSKTLLRLMWLALKDNVLVR